VYQIEILNAYLTAAAAAAAEKNYDELVFQNLSDVTGD